MPWSIEQDRDDCNYAVVDENGDTVGCHDTQDDAQAHLAALNANVDETIEASETVPLTEATDGDGGMRRLIRIISPGWGASGYYSSEVLERDGPDFVPAGTQMFLDHPTWTEEQDRPERSVRDLAAVTIEEAHWELAGPAGPGLYARADVFAPWAPLIDELEEHIGVSIRGRATSSDGEAEGRRGRIIERLVPPAHSVDFVTRAGRGGQILELYEAARRSGGDDPWLSVEEAETRLAEARNVGAWFESRIHRDFTVTADDRYGDGYLTRPERIALSSAIGDALDAFRASLEDGAPQLFDRDLWDDPEATEDVNEESEAAMPDVTETQLQEVADERDRLADRVQEVESERDDALAERDRAREALQVRDLRDLVAAAIDDSDHTLTDTARQRVTAAVERRHGDLLDDDGELDTDAVTEAANEQIADEVAYLTEATGRTPGRPSGLGSNGGTQVDESSDDPDFYIRRGVDRDTALALAGKTGATSSDRS